MADTRAEKSNPDKRYFVQVGAESIEVPAEHVALHGDGAAFSTSKPVLFHSVRILDGESTYTGTGNSWEAADEDATSQLPKAVSK